MIKLLQPSVMNTFKLPVCRLISTTSCLSTKGWRVSQRLPINKNAEGVLTDGTDYTFLDGRPTPLLHKQRLRVLKHRNFASQIVQLNSELDFAIEREKKMKETKEQERQKILNNKLKPKGVELFKKKT